MIDHGELRELAAGAALDDLDPIERAALDAHLATCAGCRRLTGELDDLLADLVLTAPERVPPPQLARDVLAAIRAPDRRTLGAVPAPVRQPPPVAGRRRLSALAGLAAAAAVAALAVGLGWRAQALERELGAVRAEQDRERALLAVAADPAHRTAGLHAPAGPSATVIWVPGTDGAWLVSHDLPATPEGRVYQLWHADASGVHPLGTLAHDGDGPLIAPFGVDLADSAAAMVTLEPPGGARGEAGPEVVFGELRD